MRFEKTIATLFTAMMLVITAQPVLATNLGDYPEPFCVYDAETAKSTCDFLVVAGKDAAPMDVVGMTDLASRLAQESYELVSTGAVTTVTGGKTEDVPFAKNLAATGYFDRDFDDDDLAGLLDSEVTFSGDSYSFHEEIILAANSPFICNSLNCSEDDYKDAAYMEISTGALSYYYVWDEAINISTVSSTYPLEIDFLGKALKLTSVPISGDRFTAYVGDSYSMNVGDCVDIEGKSVCLENVASTGAVKVTIDGTSYTISGTETHEGVEIAVDDYFTSDTLSERAATLVIGKDAQETYVNGNKYVKDDNICNNDPEDTDCWEWVIAGLNTNQATTGLTGSAAGPRIGIVSRFVINDYDDDPITAGECYEFPNDYASVCFDSLTVDEDDYMTFEMEVAKGVTLNSTSGWDNEDCLYLHTDVSEGLQLESDAFSNAINGTALSTDTKTQQIWLAPDFGGADSALQGNFSVWYLGSDGTRKYAGELGCDLASGYGQKFARVYYGDTKDDNIEIYCQNISETVVNVTFDILGKTSTDLANGTDDIKTFWTLSSAAWSYLGKTEGDADAEEMRWCRGTGTGCNWLNIGTKDEDHTSDYGIVIKNPDSTGNGEEVVFEIPKEQAFAKIVIKGPGTTIAESGDTIKKVIPIETAIAKLDYEVGESPGAHLILIGDAAVNTLAAEVMGLTYPTYGASGLYPYTEGQAIIKVYDDAIETGYVALLVAGWDAEDTRNACSVMQQYGTFADQLDENEAVIVTSVSAAGITAYVETPAEGEAEAEAEGE